MTYSKLSEGGNTQDTFQRGLRLEEESYSEKDPEGQNKQTKQEPSDSGMLNVCVSTRVFVCMSVTCADVYICEDAMVFVFGVCGQPRKVKVEQIKPLESQ